jgi:hypothetical protein
MPDPRGVSTYFFYIQIFQFFFIAEGHFFCLGRKGDMADGGLAWRTTEWLSAMSLCCSWPPSASTLWNFGSGQGGFDLGLEHAYASISSRAHCDLKR